LQGLDSLLTFILAGGRKTVRAARKRMKATTLILQNLVGKKNILFVLPLWTKQTTVKAVVFVLNVLKTALSNGKNVLFFKVKIVFLFA